MSFQLNNGHAPSNGVLEPLANGLANGEKKEKRTLAGMKCDLRNLYEGPPDRRGRCGWTATYPDDLEDPPETAESAQYALLLRNKKCYDGRRKLRLDSIVVQSPLLKEVLADVLEDYPGICTTALQRLEFNAPFEPFVHRWERLTKAKDSVTDPEAKDHIELLYNVLETELRDTLREAKDLVHHSIINFDLMWTIFEPGSLIYSVEEGHEHVYRLKNGAHYSDQMGRAYVLRLQYVDFDGENFGMGERMVKLWEFQGTKPITELRAIPFHKHPKQDAIREKLIARGKLFEAYQGFHFKAYDGVGIVYTGCGPVRFTVASRIIIDTYAYNRFNPNRKVSLEYVRPEGDGDVDLNARDTDESVLKHTQVAKMKLSEAQQLLCTAKLRGYSLKDKKWLNFFIPSVRDIEWNESAFNSLVAPPEQKELILAFAQSQNKNKGCFDDVIQGKGRGIILLLSGPPGVGKTLTAESVAETMKVPLYMMSAGDLGTEPGDVESALSNILEMSTKWNAVLLLDEADVFLEARSPHDLERNKLVSIFLRLLEYYEGILFLTTNRVDNIDAAFESRIHLSLQYDELDKASRKHVWTTFLSRSNNVDTFTDEQLDQLAESKLNGRQIKNILKTSQLLAAKDDLKLSFGHVNTVMRLRTANMRKLPSK